MKEVEDAVDGGILHVPVVRIDRERIVGERHFEGGKVPDPGNHANHPLGHGAQDALSGKRVRDRVGSAKRRVARDRAHGQQNVEVAVQTAKAHQ